MNWKHYSSVTLLFLACAVFLLPTPSIAKTDVVYASYKYVMGDNDTKNDAKRLCFLEAKRRCLEKVGSYVESLTEVQDYQLTKDEIRSYTAAIIKVEVVSETISFEGESVVINTTVKAEIDPDHTKRELQKIKKDKALQARIKEQQTQIESLENKIRKLQVELDSTSYEKSLELRGERKEALGNLYVANERIKKIILTKRARDVERPRIVALRKRNRRLVLQYVELGMTYPEVSDIIREIADGEDLVQVKEGNPISNKISHKFQWDDMMFSFWYDRYTELWTLRSIIFRCYGSVHLKTECFNILDLGSDVVGDKKIVAKDTLDEILSKRVNYDCKRQALMRLLYCPQLIKRYLWGEE